MTLTITLIVSVLVAGCGGSQPSQASVTPGPSASGGAAPRSSPSTIPSLGPAAVDLPAPERLTELISGWRSRNEAPGVIVGMRIGDGEPLIVVDGEDADSGAPLPADAVFDVLSITKTFAGAVALDLIDDGKLGLDDPIETYVPGFPNGDRITVRHLLAHTSGLVPQWTEIGETPYSEEAWDFFVSGGAPDLGHPNLEHSFTPEELLEFVKDRPLEFSPGEGARYSNVNTILLGEVIEAVTGTDIGTAYRERLLDPLGLRDTYDRATEDGPPPIPGRWRDERGTHSTTEIHSDRASFTFYGGGGGMVSTAADLLDFGVAFLREGALDRVDLSQSRFQVTPNGTGLGVIPWSIDNGACVFTTFGYTPAAGDCGPFDAVTGVGNSAWGSSMLAYFPRWDLTVVAYSNAGSGMPSEVEGLLDEIVTSMFRGQ
jgi:D-alanyl-D-alanine carboxypeptidase